MDHRPDLLKELRIVSPCEMDWDRMPGTERERHCSSCEQTVVDLSLLSTAEATALVTGSHDRLCVRIHRRDDGTVVTSDSPEVFKTSRRRTLQNWASIAASWLGLTAWAGCNRKTSTRVEGGEPSVRELGDVVVGQMCVPNSAQASPNPSGTPPATPIATPIASPSAATPTGPNIK